MTWVMRCPFLFPCTDGDSIIVLAVPSFWETNRFPWYTLPLSSGNASTRAVISPVLLNQLCIAWFYLQDCSNQMIVLKAIPMTHIKESTCVLIKAGCMESGELSLRPIGDCFMVFQDRSQGLHIGLSGTAILGFLSPILSHLQEHLGGSNHTKMHSRCHQWLPLTAMDSHCLTIPCRYFRGLTLGWWW